MNFAILDLEKNYEAFEVEFTAFFNELVVFSKQKYTSICEY